MFNKEELSAIQELIGRASLQGKEAISVALIQQKLANLLQSESEAKNEAAEKKPKK